MFSIVTICCSLDIWSYSLETIIIWYTYVLLYVLCGIEICWWSWILVILEFVGYRLLVLALSWLVFMFGWSKWCYKEWYWVWWLLGFGVLVISLLVKILLRWLDFILVTLKSVWVKNLVKMEWMVFGPAQYQGFSGLIHKWNFKTL